VYIMLMVSEGLGRIRYSASPDSYKKSGDPIQQREVFLARARTPRHHRGREPTATSAGVAFARRARYFFIAARALTKSKLLQDKTGSPLTGIYTIDDMETVSGLCHVGPRVPPPGTSRCEASATECLSLLSVSQP